MNEAAEQQRADPPPLTSGTQESLGESADAKASADGGEQSATAPPLDPAYDSRRQRIFDLRAKALDDSNPFVACLGGAKSDLFDLGLDLGEHLRHAIAAGEFFMEDSTQHARTFDWLLRVDKQIVQFAQLELRVRKEDTAAAGLQTEAKKAHVCAPTKSASTCTEDRTSVPNPIPS